MYNLCMRLLHTSDLHLGKTLYGYSLLQQQKESLDFIVETIKEKKIDVLLVAGDIYDKTNPNNGAIELWNDFLNRLAMVEPSVEVVVIAGNHDSFVKLDYGSDLFKSHHIHIWSKPLDDNHPSFFKLSLTDKYGPLNIYGTPFVRPMNFPGWKTTDNYGYTKMMQDLLNHQDIDSNQRNIWVSHQFYVTSSMDDVTTSESESSVLLSGGLDAITLKDMVLPFDYMALGHLHTYQKLKDIPAYYSGSIYPYSLSETIKSKRIIFIELNEKGNMMVEPLSIPFQRNVRVLSMDYMDILDDQDGLNHDDYVAIELPKPCGDPQYLQKLSLLYPNLLTVSVVEQNHNGLTMDEPSFQVDLDPITNIHKLYQTIYGSSMDDALIQWLNHIHDEVNL